jgi:hypothetical protein
MQLDASCDEHTDDRVPPTESDKAKRTECISKVTQPDIQSSSQGFVDLRLKVKPQTKHLGIAERYDLTAYDSADPLLSITPPPAVREPGPEPSTLGPTSRASVGKHERQSPALRRLTLHWIYVGNSVCEIGLGRWDSLTTKVGELWYLIREHEVYRLLLEELGSGLGRGAVAEKRCDDFLNSVRGVVDMLQYGQLTRIV